MFRIDAYGFGIYEGQCTKNGDTCGMGFWRCTEPPAHKAKDWLGLTYEGYFKNDRPQSFGMS